MPDRRSNLQEKPGLGVRLLGTVISVLIVLLLAGGIAEIFSRTVVDDGMHFDLEMWKYAKDIKKEADVPELGHEHKPGSSAESLMGVPVLINSLGLRDREYPVEKPPGVIRVLMLGDSLTFGWGVKIEDTPSKIVERKLNEGKAQPAFEVINAGVGNYNTVQEVTYFLKKGYKLKPDVVVLNYFINDAEPTPVKKENLLAESSYAAVVGLSAFDTISRAYFGKADWREYYAGLYREDAAPWQAAKKAIADLAAYCRQNNIKLLIVNYPELHVLKDYPFGKVTAAVREQATAHQVPFLDLLPSVTDLVPETLWVSPTDAHPNLAANQRFSEAIAKTLRDSFPELFQR